ncbi:ferredoxin [Variovorax terrae]|uniref:Ferredoxin n=1 Tax=Variovorax terrae TaxID=2923278 RepID=A0A9X1VYF0_9BURK|nr:ferredoxin [Variovorax terrae]MCJ0764444.1 ferredoxin [Variovorax terrae]
MSTYVILTSRPGQFRTEAVDGLQPLETYEYRFCGRARARFVIAELLTAVKVRIVDETFPPVVNHVPSKFLEKFSTLDHARGQLMHLAACGGGDAELVRQ